MNLIKKIKEAIETKREKIEIEKEAEGITEKFFNTFNSGHAFTGDLDENNPLWQAYTNKRGSFSTYEPSSYSGSHESEEATKINVREYIEDLVKLRKEGKIQCSDIEIIALSAVMDEIDYSFACGLMVYPSSVSEIEDGIFKADKDKVLISIVNSLVYKYNINPFEMESRIKELYFQDEIRFLNKSWQYTGHLIKKLKEN